MRQGVIVQELDGDHLDIRLDLDENYGGLHCGQCFDVLIHGRWIPTRLEKQEDWYLIGIPTQDLIGLRVRINC